MNVLSRRSWLRLVVFGVGATLLVPRLGAAETTPLYALCAAYPPEIAALQKEFGVTEENGFTRTTINGLVFWRGRYAGREVIVFRTGVSVVNAAYQLQLGLDHFPITHVLFAGVAGGTDPALQVGDVVVPEQWAYHAEAAYLNEDEKGGYVLPEYLRPQHGNFGMIFPADVSVIRDGDADYQTISSFPVDVGLIAAARRALPKVPAMRQAGRTVSLSVGGMGVSGPVFLDNARYREWVFKVWQARCVDMESAALAHVAYANRKPILVVRALSDLAGAQHTKNPIDANEVPVSGIAARVLRAIVEEL